MEESKGESSRPDGAGVEMFGIRRGSVTDAGKLSNYWPDLLGNTLDSFSFVPGLRMWDFVCLWIREYYIYCRRL